MWRIQGTNGWLVNRFLKQLKRTVSFSGRNVFVINISNSNLMPNVNLSPFSETHLEVVRGLICQQKKLDGVTLPLHSRKTGRSSLYQRHGLDSKWRNLDYSGLLIFSIFLTHVGFGSTTYILYLINIIFFITARRHLSHVFLFPVLSAKMARNFVFGGEIW